MPIKQVQERMFAPIRGKIRLGVKEEVRAGVSKPVNVEYFVLKDALDVKEVYGEEPTEIDVIFPTNDIEHIIPTWFKLYAGGKKRGDGSTSPGRLLCRGDGPDSMGNPGTAVHYAQRDPVTGVTPTRECLGQNCPDFKDARGRQMCYQNMQVLCFIPRVSMMGVYLITTRSWNSITSFHNMINWVNTVNNGNIAGVPFKIVRRARDIWTKLDNGQEVQRTHYIMELEPNEEFYEKHGKNIQELVGRAFSSPILLPDKEEVISLPAASAFMPTDETEQEVVQENIQNAESLVDDPATTDGFNWLEQQIGVQYSRKNRIIFIRKLEGTVPPPELPSAINKRIRELAEEHKSIAEKKSKPVEAEKTATVDSAGVI